RALPRRPRARSAPRAPSSFPFLRLRRRTRCRARRRRLLVARSRALYPAHRPELAPRRAGIAARIVLDVALANALHQSERQLARALDLPPERILLKVVVIHEAGNALVACLSSQEPSFLSHAGLATVYPTQR